jgi:hypothetical protein
VERSSGDELRLGMLETIREYALERLELRGDGEAVHRLHAGFYAALAGEAESRLLGREQRAWLERLDAERENSRAALTWASASGEADLGLRILAPLWRFWNLRNHDREARGRLEELLATGSAAPATRAIAQSAIGSLAHWQGDHETVPSRGSWATSGASPRGARRWPASRPSEAITSARVPCSRRASSSTGAPRMRGASPGRSVELYEAIEGALEATADVERAHVPYPS